MGDRMVGVDSSTHEYDEWYYSNAILKLSTYVAVGTCGVVESLEWVENIKEMDGGAIQNKKITKAQFVDVIDEVYKLAAGETNEKAGHT